MMKFFSNKKNDIYNNLTPIIFSFTYKVVDGNNVYRIIDNNQNNIIITENNIMDYKIFVDIY